MQYKHTTAFNEIQTLCCSFCWLCTSHYFPTLFHTARLNIELLEEKISNQPEARKLSLRGVSHSVKGDCVHSNPTKNFKKREGVAEGKSNLCFSRCQAWLGRGSITITLPRGVIETRITL